MIPDLKPNKRLAFYRYSYLNRGGDRMVIEYANHLAELGWSITLYGAIFDTVFEIHKQVRQKKIASNLPIFLSKSLLHWREQHLIIADIIHLALPLSFQNKIIYFAQADDRQYYKTTFAHRIIDFLYHLYFKRELPVITVSESLAELFKNNYHATSCKTVTNGINHRLFFPNPRKNLLVKKNGRTAIFLMARGDHFRKGFDIALKCLQKLPSSVCKKITLWICGEEIPKELFAFPVINFGIVSDQKLCQILSSADLLFYPSRHEGFGLFPLEAMACGCAVLTTEAVPYAGHTKGIVCVKVGDQEALLANLSKLLSNSEFLNNLKRKTISSAAEYNIDKSKQMFAEALSKIVRH